VKKDHGFVFTCSDDCSFKGWDERDLSNPTFVNKQHEAGVTCLSRWPYDDNLIMTGSYDKHIKFWDIRNMRKCVNDVFLDRQIWDFKFNGDLLGIS